MTEKQYVTGVSLYPEDVESLERIQKEHGVGRSAAIRIAIRRYAELVRIPLVGQITKDGIVNTKTE